MYLMSIFVNGFGAQQYHQEKNKSHSVLKYKTMVK